MGMAPTKVEMCWVDMETTGLDAYDCVPLELGFTLTDKMGNVVDTWESLIWDKTPDFQRAVTAGMKDSFVGPLHEKSGLWKDLQDPDGPRRMTRSEAQRAVTNWLKTHGVGKDLMPLSGSSIGSLDRPFLQQHFMLLNDYLSYRNIDVSTIKELARLHRPALVTEAEKHKWQKGEASHRVLGDIEASIREYLFYVNEGFLVP